MASLTNAQQAALASQAMAQMGPGIASGGLAAANPYSAGIMAAGQIGAALLADKTPMSQASPQTVGYDSSGWAVTVGDGSSSNVDQVKTPNPTAATLARAVGGINPLVILLIVGGIGAAWYLSK